MKIDSLYNGLYRKGLITDSDTLTTEGHALLEFMNSKGSDKLPKRQKTTSEFEEWWKTYPGTDTFVHKGKSFSGSRTLRNAKEDCRIKFDKILLEGEYTAAQLIEALNYDVLQKKEASILHRMNKLSFLQNSLTYLNQRSFEPFIELINEGIQIKETHVSKGSTDI